MYQGSVREDIFAFGRVKAKVKPHHSTQQRRKTGRKRHRFGSRSPYDRGGGKRWEKRPSRPNRGGTRPVDGPH